MKIGNLKITKDYSTGKTMWAIYGRVSKGVWVLVASGKRDLLFNLQYDACSFLAAVYEESKDREVIRKGYGYQPRSTEEVG